MILNLRKWGNSKAIRLPKRLLAELNGNYDFFNAKVEDEKLILTPAVKDKALDKLFKNYSGAKADYPFEIVDKGGAIGEELY